MKTLRTLLAAATAALALAACRDETPAAPPAPQVAPTPSATTAAWS